MALSHSFPCNILPSSSMKEESDAYTSHLRSINLQSKCITTKQNVVPMKDSYKWLVNTCAQHGQTFGLKDTQMTDDLSHHSCCRRQWIHSHGWYGLAAHSCGMLCHGKGLLSLAPALILGTGGLHDLIYCRCCRQAHWGSLEWGGQFYGSCCKPSHWCSPQQCGLACSSCCRVLHHERVDLGLSNPEPGDPFCHTYGTLDH